MHGNNMNLNTVLKKSVIFITGLFIMATGVTLSVKANLGVSPISCIPYVYCLKYPLTLGETTVIMNIFLIICQIVLLRKNYQWFQLIQLPVVFLFGFFIDFTMHMLSWIEPTFYLWKFALCLLGCIVLALGVFFEVKAKLTYLPGEGLAMAVTQTFSIEFGKTKIGTDSSMVIIGIISSVILLNSLQGIREGTIIAAFFVGYIVKFFNSHLSFLEKLLRLEEDAVVEEVKVEGNSRLVITISREYGSGGHEIGKQVAGQLGLKFYDKELIKLTSEKSGFTPEYINEHEQKLVHSLFYHLYEQNYVYTNEQKPPLNALFMVQSKIIRDIYEKESCVIIGRCANFVLKDKPGCINVFIHAANDFREKRIAENKEYLSNEKENIDKERANHCRQFTGKVWNNCNNYHLVIDSSALGISESAKLIVEAVERFKAHG